jgi:hypothetical protein
LWQSHPNPEEIVNPGAFQYVLLRREKTMKKLMLMLAFLGLVSFGCATQANAGVHVGIGIGGPGYYGPDSYYGYPPPYYGGYYPGYYGYYGPGYGYYHGGYYRHFYGHGHYGHGGRGHR